MKTNEFICWNAGCGIFEVEKYNKNIDWQKDNDVFKGTYNECVNEQKRNN